MAKKATYDELEQRVLELEKESAKHKESREALSEENEYLKSILNHIADPITVKDNKYRWNFVNDKFCEISGASRKELTGKSYYDFFENSEANIFHKRDKEVFKTGQEIFSEEYLTNSSTGERILLNTKKTLFKGRKGQEFIVAIGRDITERKRIEREFKDSEARFKAIYEHSPWHIHSQFRRGSHVF